MPIALQNFRSISRQSGDLFVNNKGQLGIRGGSFASKLVTWIKGLYKPTKIRQENHAAVQQFLEAIHTLKGSEKLDVDSIVQPFHLSQNSPSLSSRTVRQILENIDERLTATSAPQVLAHFYSDYDLNNRAYGLGKVVQTAISDHPALSVALGATEFAAMSQGVNQAILRVAEQKHVTSAEAQQIAQTAVIDFLRSQQQSAQVDKALGKETQPQPSPSPASDDTPQATTTDSTTVSGDTPQAATLAMPEAVAPPPSNKQPSENKEALLSMLKKVEATFPDELKEKITSGVISSKAELIKESNQYIARWVSNGRIHRWYVDAYREKTGKTPPQIPKELIQNISDKIQSSSSIVHFALAEEYSKKAIDDTLRQIT